MKRAALHAAYEHALARALRADDPVASLRATGANDDCSAALRCMLERVCMQPAGLRTSALICARLRFERLLHGSAHASRMFAEDPAQFAALFRSYHQSVPPTAHGPRAEATLFDDWRASGMAQR